jgi:hypothetical protein
MPHSFSSSEVGGSVLLQNVDNLYQTYKYHSRLDYNYCKKNIYWYLSEMKYRTYILPRIRSYKEGVINMDRTEITSEYVDWIALRSD